MITAQCQSIFCDECPVSEYFLRRMPSVRLFSVMNAKCQCIFCEEIPNLGVFSLMNAQCQSIFCYDA